MSKSANAGELRTSVKFVRRTRCIDAEGYPIANDANVFGDGKSVAVKWVNAHGADAYTALQLQLREPATLTMRYSPKITPDLLVYKGDDPKPYEIISIDNVGECGVWMEVKVQRKVAAR